MMITTFLFRVKLYIEGEIKKINSSVVSHPNIETYKQIAAHIVNILADFYIKDMIKEGKWPKQCDSPYEFIFGLDLGYIIKMEGNQDAFKQLYCHSVTALAEMQNNDSEFQLSNNDNDCLAYINFLQLVRSFAFLHYKERGHIPMYERSRDVMVIKIINGEPYLGSYSARTHEFQSEGKFLCLDPFEKILTREIKNRG